MMRIAKRARARERGAVAVEFAMVTPLLLLLLLGVIDFGRIMYVKNALLQSASQGARLYAIGKDAAGASVETQTATSLQIRAMSMGGAEPTFSVSPGTNPACPTNSDTATVTVTASVSFKWITPVYLFSRAGSMNSLSATATWLCVKTVFP